MHIYFTLKEQIYIPIIVIMKVKQKTFEKRLWKFDTSYCTFPLSLNSFYQNIFIAKTKGIYISYIYFQIMTFLKTGINKLYIYIYIYIYKPIIGQD